jgi:hypothetical protein
MVKVGGTPFPAFTVFISARQKKSNYIFFNINQNLPKKGGHPSKNIIYFFLGIVQNLPKKGGKGVLFCPKRHFSKIVPKKAEKVGKGVLPPPVLAVHDLPKNSPPFPPFPPFFQQVSKNACTPQTGFTAFTVFFFSVLEKMSVFTHSTCA